MLNAKAYVIQGTLLFAARKGMSAMAHIVGLWPRSLLDEEDIVASLPKQSSKCGVPLAFHFLKQTGALPHKYTGMVPPR